MHGPPGWLDALNGYGEAFRSAAALLQAGAALGAYGLFRSQLRERRHRAQPALSVSLEVSSFRSTAGDGVVLETRVTLENPTHGTWCVPAVYVAARALAAVGTHEHDFESLPLIPKLSDTFNVAKLERSIIQLGPDETEHLVRWDLVPTEVLTATPVMVVAAQVFCADGRFLALHHGPTGSREHRLRREWIDMVNEVIEGGVTRHAYVAFSRASTDSSAKRFGFAPAYRKGSRVLLRPDGSVDERETKRFRGVLHSVVQWDRHATVDLLADRGAGSARVHLAAVG